MEGCDPLLKKHIQRTVRYFGYFAALLLTALNFSGPMAQLRALPDVLRADAARERIPALLSSGLFSSKGTVSVSSSLDESLSDGKGLATFQLLGHLPIKSVEIKSGEEILLSPGGSAVGIAIQTQGVLVVGFGTVETPDGPKNPGASCGLQPGDRILAVNGVSVRNAEHLASLLPNGDTACNLSVMRENQSLTVSLKPVSDVNGSFRLGLWVRDSTAGVGTLSFYDGENRRFAALGHPVSDVDTHSLLTVQEGNLLSSKIVSVVPGAEGSPGELTGSFSTRSDTIGTIDSNTEYGIFGTLYEAYENGLCGQVPLAEPGEAHTGGAVLISTVTNDGPTAYDCEILRISAQNQASAKGMVLRITDPDLIQTTGGIVQGMSGSPVLQDGRLIGVVTHVFVNDPLKGYCIYARWMYDKMIGN